MNALFNISDFETSKNDLLTPDNHYRCKHCKHIFMLSYSKNIFYCDKIKSNRTITKRGKIKANNKACYLFKLKE